MITLANLFKLKDHKTVEPEVLDEVFRMERSTLITLILLETILLYILTPLLGNIVIAWYGITVALSLWRLYNAYDYTKNPDRNTLTVWHEKFVVQVWLTALLFSVLALYAMPHLNAYYQLFVFIVLVGISSGAVKALAQDHRTAIGYLIIILFPLMIEMLLLMRKDTYILAFLVVIYFFTQISIILSSYQKSETLKEKEKEIESAKAKLYEKQIMVQRFFEQASEALLSYDTDLKLLDCNDAFVELFSIKHKSDIIGESLTNIMSDKLSYIVSNSLKRNRRIYRGPLALPDGRELWVEMKLSTIKDAKGNVTGGIGVIEDNTKEHNAREELEYLVTHDPLTSVLNRRGFHDFMDEFFKKEKHNTHYSLLLYFDLNRFKQINDMYGHDIGDWVLIETTIRLKNTIDSESRLVRLGGDEFSLIMPYVSRDKEGALKRLEEWVDRAREEFSKPFEVDGRVLDVGYSIGVVVIEPKENDIEKLIRKADISMFQAKKEEDGSVFIYDETIAEKYDRLYLLQRDLSDAFEQGQFELFFQPIVSVSDGKIRAAEVLVRWIHPDKGMLTPGEFLEIVSKAGRITDLDEWVLQKSCETIKKWKDEGYFNINHLSINIDTRLLFGKNIINKFNDLKKNYNLYNGELKIEITEASLVNNFEEAHNVLEQLHKEGFDCAIDDFGTGYSSLSYLKRLSFRILKIDKDFVADLTDRIENILILRTIIDMGTKLNYEIVVEGIESETQRQILKTINSDLYCQGYLISKPLPEKEFVEKFLLGRK